MSDRATRSCLVRAAFRIAADVAPRWRHTAANVQRSLHDAGLRDVLRRDANLHCGGWDHTSPVAAQDHFGACAIRFAIQALESRDTLQGIFSAYLGSAVASAAQANASSFYLTPQVAGRRNFAPDRKSVARNARRYLNELQQCPGAGPILNDVAIPVLRDHMSTGRGRQRKVES